MLWLLLNSWALSAPLVLTCIVLVVPLLHDTKLSVLMWCGRLPMLGSFIQMTRLLGAGMFVSLLFAARTAINALNQASTRPNDTFALLRLAEAQRDVLHQAALVLLAAMAYRLTVELYAFGRLRMNLEVLQKQASHMSSAYSLLLDEKNELEASLVKRGDNKKQAHKGSMSVVDENDNGGGGADNDVDQLKREAKTLADKCSEVEKQLRTSERRSSALKKQVDVHQNEFARLKKQNDTLRSQLSDYEVVFGDQRKKNI